MHGHKKFAQIIFIPPFFLFFVEEQTGIHGGWKLASWTGELKQCCMEDWHLSEASLVDE